MNIYELIKSIPQDMLTRLVRAKVITPEWRKSVLVYDYFQQMCKETGRMDAYDRTGEKFYMSDENVRRIIRKLSAPAPA